MTTAPPEDGVSELERYRQIIQYECPVRHCRARAGEPCRGLPAPNVHESRRLKRLRALVREL